MRVKYDTTFPFRDYYFGAKKIGRFKKPSSSFFSRCGMAVVRISTLIAIKHNNKLQNAAHTVVWAAFVGTHVTSQTETNKTTICCWTFYIFRPDRKNKYCIRKKCIWLAPPTPNMWDRFLLLFLLLKKGTTFVSNIVRTAFKKCPQYEAISNLPHCKLFLLYYNIPHRSSPESIFAFIKGTHNQLCFQNIRVQRHGIWFVSWHLYIEVAWV